MSFTMAIFVFWCLNHVCNHQEWYLPNYWYKFTFDLLLLSVMCCLDDVCFCLNYFVILDMSGTTFHYCVVCYTIVLSYTCFGSLWIVSCSIIICVGLRISNLFCWLHVSKFNLMHVHLHLLNHLKIC